MLIYHFYLYDRLLLLLSYRINITLLSNQYQTYLELWPNSYRIYLEFIRVAILINIPNITPFI